jgi:hypothetical protein
VLGVVHSLWKPLPGRFKDFIAMSKSNGYQSLHTTVISHSGEPIEIQIRTFEMHRIAEFGVAAHWAYKEGTEGPIDQKLSWLRLLMEWQKEVVDAESFVDAVRVDLFQDEVFVFSPKGDVYNLPAGSTPVDFAYRVHTEVGHRCLGGKVNGRMVPLDYELKNGEIVEILTTKAPHGPSRDWLNFVKSASARERIRKWFKSQAREENVAKGRDLLEKELLRMHRLTLAQLPEGKLEEMAREKADVEEAIARLRQGISNLNREGRKRLLEAFDTVNGHFQRLFQTLFGGGSAELKLVDSDDPLQSGLEILACPPGKRPQVLTLLSGGEKALTALALIFAVFLTNPSPICVLDEVDAPLDDANVERFCRLMEEMAKETDTRFLIITHHPLTMARMSRLFGVTMAERGISQLVSVDLENAERLRDAS